MSLFDTIEGYYVNVRHNIKVSQMDNFETRMWLKYTLKLLDEFDFSSYQFENFYDCLKHHLHFKKAKLRFKNRKEEVKFAKEFKEYVTKKLEKIKPAPSLIEDKFLYLKEMYNLDDIEYEIMVYYTLREINKMFVRMTDSVTSHEINFGVEYLDLKTFEAKEKADALLKRGILTAERDFGRRVDLEPSIPIIKVFESTTKIEDIQEIMLGEPQKSNLKWKDFEYLGNERDIVQRLLTSAIKNKAVGINILLWGSVGTGKTEFAKLVANKSKINQYIVASSFSSRENSRNGRINDLLSKQNILSKIGNACILFDEAEDVMNRGFSDFGSASKAQLNTVLEQTPVPVFWTTNNITGVDPAFLRRMTYTIEFEKLSEDIRLKIWQRTIKKNDLSVDKKRLIELNKSYNLPPSLITNAVNSTKLIGGNQDDFETFIENVAKVVNKKKSVKNAKGFEMSEYNDNLVNTDIDIKDLTSKIKNCGKLNFSLCLYGEPGTGKSLYARYLANELGIDVILKRASDLKSKWHGQTEQNIAEAFAEAKSKGAMLIFDEADSFLQNRSSADHSWEISQVNEMLTWMESHEYPFVCTTNLLDTIDEASLRRFTFKIKFDFLSQSQVNAGIEHFFGIKNANVNIKGITTGDFATVKKKTDFLEINDLNEIAKMLSDEVKVKKSKSLQNSVGF